MGGSSVPFFASEDVVAGGAVVSTPGWTGVPVVVWFLEPQPARPNATATKPVNVRHRYAGMVLRFSAAVGFTAMASGGSAVRNRSQPTFDQVPVPSPS